MMKNSGEKFPFVVILKNPNNRYFDYLGLLLSLASVILFLREIFLTSKIHPIYILAVIFILGIIIYNLVRSKKGKKIYYNKALLISSLIWLRMPYGQWLFLLFVALGLMERQARAPKEIGFAEDRIIFNSLFKKQLSWSQLSNVILKDNLLTLDFKNNRLVQREVEDDEDEDNATEEEFNLFCRKMLTRNHSLRES